METLWAFLNDSPERPVPYPWERCFDMQTGMLYYQNSVQPLIIVDLRTRVNVGGGMYHESSAWHELVGPFTNYPLLAENYLDQDTPFLLLSGCQGHPLYLIVPELFQQCPFCGCSLRLFD